MMRESLRVSAGPNFRSQLVRSGFASGIIKGVNLVLLVALAVVLARILGAEGYGVYAYAFAVVQLLSIPAQMGFPVLVVREIAAYSATGRWGYLRGLVDWATVCIIAISICLVGATGLFAWYVLDGLSISELGTLSWGLALLPMLALGAFRGAALRGLQRVIRGQIPELVLRPGIFLICLSIVWLLSGGVEFPPEQAMAIHALSGFVALLIGGALLRRHIADQVRAAPRQFDTARWAKSAVTMSLVTGMHIINAQADIIMLGPFTDAATVGTYRVAMQGALLVAFVLQALNMVVAPQYSRLHVERDLTRLERLAIDVARISLMSALPLVATYIFFGDQILSIVFGHEFEAGYYCLIIISLGQLVNTAMGSVVILLNMTNHEKIVARLMAISAALNVVLNLILIPIWGMEGAATATSVSLVCWNLLLGKAVLQKLGFSSWAFARLRYPKWSKTFSSR